MSWKSLNEMHKLGLISRNGNRMNNILVNTGINDYINIVYAYGHWYNVENLHLQLNPNEKKYDYVMQKPAPPPKPPKKKENVELGVTWYGPNDPRNFNASEELKRSGKLIEWGEPPPTKGGQVVYTELIKDIESRAEFGRMKYGQDLMTEDGRNTLKDAFEEALDLLMYLKKLMMEQEND